MPFGKARYGANISGFTQANPGVLSVDSTQFFSIGDTIRVANCVCETTGSQLNGDYLITDLSTNTITLDVDTSSFGNYISGGVVTVMEEANPYFQPYSQSNLYKDLIPWTVFNQAKGGGTIPYF